MRDQNKIWFLHLQRGEGASWGGLRWAEVGRAILQILAMTVSFWYHVCCTCIFWSPGMLQCAFVNGVCCITQKSQNADTVWSRFGSTFKRRDFRDNHMHALLPMELLWASSLRWSPSAATKLSWVLIYTPTNHDGHITNHNTEICVSWKVCLAYTNS